MPYDSELLHETSELKGRQKSRRSLCKIFLIYLKEEGCLINNVRTRHISVGKLDDLQIILIEYFVVSLSL